MSEHTDPDLMEGDDMPEVRLAQEAPGPGWRVTAGVDLDNVVLVYEDLTPPEETE